MKATIQTLFYSALCLCLISIFIYGCKDMTDNKAKVLSNEVKLNSISIMNIKADYESKMGSIRVEGGNKNVKTTRRKLYWDNVRKISKDNEQKLIVPFVLDEEIYAKFPDSSHVAYSSIATFIVSESKGKYYYEVATYFPDLEWLQNRTKPFSGRIVVEDINGNFLKGV
jgi:hypothetical protein